MDDVRELNRQLTDPRPGNRPSSLAPGLAVSEFLSKGEVVILERGDVVERDIGVVMTGTVAIEHRLSNGRRILSALFRANDWIDQRRFERKAQGLLTALGPAQMLLLSDRDVDSLSQRDGFFATELSTQLRELFARARDHVTDLANKTPVERLASVLFEFRRWPENQRDGAADVVVILPITRADIADYLGLQPETVSRALATLEKDGLIKFRQINEIQLLDPPSLRRIANGGRPRKSNGWR